MSQSSNKTDINQTNSPLGNQSDNPSNRKFNIPLRLLYELKNVSYLIFFDTEYFLENFKPKYQILYETSEFIKYKNLFAYDMEIIYSHTPNIKIVKSSSDNKKTENKTSVKSHSDQGKQKHEANKIFIINNNENKAKNENSVISNNNKINVGCFNLFNPTFSSIPIFKEGSNTNNNICFLNTKRIQKITTPISTKIINSSPFKEKTTFLFKKNNSAFRNLQNEFEDK